MGDGGIDGEEAALQRVRFLANLLGEAYRLGASRETLARMLTLVAVDFAAGSVPVRGTVFNVFWKATKWNVRAIERLVGEG